MPFIKGTSGNPGGRPRGTVNKASATLRDNIASFLLKNFEKVEADFEQLTPKERVKMYADLLQYGLPKLQAVQLEADFERLPDDQLDEIIKSLTNEQRAKN